MPGSHDTPESHLPLRPVELLLLTMLTAVEVQSRFQRKVVSVDPLTLGVLTWNVSRFEIDADTLAGPHENPTLARPGLMLSLNPTNWGLADDWGLGIGLGLGLGTSDVITDVLMGLT